MIFKRKKGSDFQSLPCKMENALEVNYAGMRRHYSAETDCQINGGRCQRGFGCGFGKHAFAIRQTHHWKLAGSRPERRSSSHLASLKSFVQADHRSDPTDRATVSSQMLLERLQGFGHDRSAHATRLDTRARHTRQRLPLTCRPSQYQRQPLHPQKDEAFPGNPRAVVRHFGR